MAPSYVRHDSAYLSYDSFIRETWLIYTCVYCHDFFFDWNCCCVHICEMCIIHMWDMTRSYMYSWRCNCVMAYVTCLTRTPLVSCMWDMTHLLCETWLIHMRDMNRSCVRHDSFIYVHSQRCNCITNSSCIQCCVEPSNSYVWHDPFVCPSYLWHDSINESCLTYEWVMSHIANEWDIRMSFVCVTWLHHMCDVTHSCVWHDAPICSLSSMAVAPTNWRSFSISSAASISLSSRPVSACVSITNVISIRHMPHTQRWWMMFVTHTQICDWTQHIVTHCNTL